MTQIASRAWAVAMGVLIMGAVGHPAWGKSGEPRLLSHWCAEEFGAAWFGTVRRATGDPMCSKRLTSGPGYEHRVISRSDLCASGFEWVDQQDPRFRCASPEDQADTSSDPDKRCKATYGEEWFATDGLGGTRLCTKRTQLGLIHRPLDHSSQEHPGPTPALSGESEGDMASRPDHPEVQKEKPSAPSQPSPSENRQEGGGRASLERYEGLWEARSYYMDYGTFQQQEDSDEGILLNIGLDETTGNIVFKPIPSSLVNQGYTPHEFSARSGLWKLLSGIRVNGSSAELAFEVEGDSEACPDLPPVQHRSELILSVGSQLSIVIPLLPGLDRENCEWARGADYDYAQIIKFRRFRAPEPIEIVRPSADENVFP